VIEYALLPLYDPSIPLESFMSSTQAGAFRGAIRNATEAAWTATQTCTSNINCTSGFCKPNVDFVAKSVNYTCVVPGSAGSSAPAPLSPAAMARELPARMPLSQSGGTVAPSLPLLQVGAP
jgi:hypothetical protein